MSILAKKLCLLPNVMHANGTTYPIVLIIVAFVDLCLISQKVSTAECANSMRLCYQYIRMYC